MAGEDRGRQMTLRRLLDRDEMRRRELGRPVKSHLRGFGMLLVMVLLWFYYGFSRM